MTKPKILNKKINWKSKESYFLLDKKQEISLQVKNKILSQYKLSSHVFIASSGTLSAKEIKIIALSKKALLASAKSVNKHLKITKKDKILSVLPACHVSDLSAQARAYQAKAFFISTAGLKKWSSLSFLKLLKKHKISVTSLVPTQVFDLVKKQLRPPKHLRIVLVGGSALSPELCKQALNLSWPLLPTYGMTELCSQIATASLSDLKKIQKLFLNNTHTNNKTTAIKKYSSLWKVLPHIKATIKKDYLCLKSSSLLSASFILKQNKIIKTKIYNKSDYFLSKDKVFLQNKKIQFKAKLSEHIKIKSKLVFLAKLQNLLEDINCKKQLQLSDIYLFPKKQEREGFSIVLISDLKHIGSDKITKLFKAFNQLVKSHEQIKQVYYLPNLPKTHLNKLKVGQIKNILQKTN